MNTTIEENYEEYICCPYCGSKNLHSEQKGFSGGKALAGAVLTGGIGLLAGTIGSKDVQITCLKCSKTFKAGNARITTNRPISDDPIENEVRKLIDQGLYLAAVKYLHEKTNCGFKEAKDKVDKMRGIEPSENSKSGCVSVILLFFILSGTLFLLI